MPRIVSASALSLFACVIAYAAACSLQSGGGLVLLDADAGSGDGASNNDASDARADGCVTCNGACVSTCDACDAGAALCTRTRECGHCDKCQGYALECFACADGGGPASAFCAMTSQSCGVPVADRCPCPFGEPMACPGKSQVCLGTPTQAACFTCGENGTINISCANGLICNDNNPMPPACTGS